MTNSKLYLGDNNIGTFFEGSSDVSLYLGDVKVYPLEVALKFQATYNNGSSPLEVACNGNTSLTSVETMPEGYEYSAMTDAVIGDCVTTLGSTSSYPFDGCKSLTSVTIPDSVTVISNGSMYKGCFSNCTSLEHITLPPHMTQLGTTMFRSCTNLKDIVIPNNVTTIPSICFQGCESLSSVTMSDSVTTIEQSAFQFCDRLSTITLSNALTTIGVNAFTKCSGLTSMTIPSTVTTIGSEAFNGCSGLTSITCLATTPPTLGYLSLNNTNNCPIYVPCNSVDDYKAADRWSDIANRIQPITESCGKFSAKYSDGSSYSAACNGNTSLTSVETMPEGYEYSAMTDAVIGDCVTTINGSVFNNGFSSLSSVTMFDSVTSIGDTAFAYCGSINRISLSNRLTSIGKRAFYLCSGLTTVNIPNTVTSIGDYTFYTCSGLTTVSLPSGLTSISTGLFERCYNLTNITIPNTVDSIGELAFNVCSGLTSLSIPSSVIAIGRGAFQYTKLTTVEIPKRVTTLSQTFQSCTNLTSATFASGSQLTTIGDSTFAYCFNLTNIEIPSGVTSIGKFAFVACYGLTSIEIPSGVTSIGNGAFENCTKLASVTVKAITPPTIGTGVFSNLTSAIYVPSESVDAYKTAWVGYADKIQPITT